MAHLKQISIIAGVVALGVTVAGATLAEAGPAAPAAHPAPSTTRISLNTWAGLLLPVNAQGQLSGKDAKVISPAKLYSPWLTQESNGDLEFWAPEGGATTPGSSHSRTELESATKYVVGTQKHALNATLEFQQLPKSNPEICIAQLHAGGTGGSDPFVLYMYKYGKVYVVMADGSTTQFYTLLTGVNLDTALSYTLQDDGNGTLTFAASSGSQKHSFTVAVPSALKGQSGHFSAGDYQQGTVSEGSNDGGKVQYSVLTQS